MRLFYKLYFYLMIGITALIVVEGWLNYEIEIQQFDEDMKRNAVEVGEILSGLIEHAWEKNGEEKTIQLIKDANSGKGHIIVRWVWLGGEVEHDHRPEISINNTADIIDGKIFSVKAKDGSGRKFRYTYYPLKLKKHSPSAIELKQSLKPLERFSRKMMIRSLNIEGLVLFISGVILYFFIRLQIYQRLVILSEKAKKIGMGDIKPDVFIKGNDELTELAETVNNMCIQLNNANDKINNVHEARIETLEQLRHTERLSTIGHIAAGIAHELGTPLNIVSGRAKMIVRDKLPESEVIENANIIRQQSERMTTIIRQLLDYSSRKKLMCSSTNINALIVQAIDILYPIAKKNKVLVNFTESSEVQILYMDPIQIQQVLINLMMNSLHAIHDEGTIDIHVFREERVKNATGDMQIYAGISIADTGCGMSPETQKHIFEPFFTTKNVGMGTGLGLSIIQDIIEEHKGWIEFESSEGSGSVFTFYLPVGTEL